MKRAQEMCKDFAGSYSCWFMLLNEPDKAEKAINEYIFAKAYLRRKENASM